MLNASPDQMSISNSNFAKLQGHSHSVCWKSVFVGLVISIVAFIGLIGLGLAFGGIGLDEASTLKGAGIYSGVWMLVSSVVALMIGSYAAVRNANFKSPDVACAQAVTGAALFLILFFSQASAMVGWIGNQAGSVAMSATAAAGTGATLAGQSSGVQDAIENVLGDVNLKNDPQAVISGVTTRLLSGDSESAKNYLARQAGITPAEADSKIAAAKTKLDEVLTQARITAAKTMKVAGWSTFLMIMLSVIAAAGGGWIASVMNKCESLAESEKTHSLMHSNAVHA